MNTTSPSLLLRLRQPGEAEAWSRFVRLYSPMLHSWACRMGLQHADAVDLVQDVFTTLLQKLPDFQYDSQHRFRSWLWTVTRNKWREKCRRAALPFDRSQPVDMVVCPEDETQEEIEFRKHLIRQVMEVMKGHFQPKTWEAFWAHVAEGKPAGEVAADLGLTESAVYKAKIRILAHLHRELGDLADDFHV